MRVKYTLGGGFLAEWMPRVNSSFGLTKFGEGYEKTGLLQPVSSSMLGDRDSNPDSQDQNLESYR